MHDERTPHEGARIAERTIVLCLLSAERDVRWSLAELQREAYDIPSVVLTDALKRHGAPVRCDDEFVASRRIWHLELLGMVSI